MRTSWLSSLLGCGFASLDLGLLAASGERLPVERTVTEAFRAAGAGRGDSIDRDELLHRVGSTEDHGDFLEVGAGHCRVSRCGESQARGQPRPPAPIGGAVMISLSETGSLEDPRAGARGIARQADDRR